LLGYVILAVVFAILLVVFFWIGATVPVRARTSFGQQRDRLQQEFFEAASKSGKPRGLRWKALDWTVSEVVPEPVLARERGTGVIIALVPVTIQFEAIAGSDMEGLPAVGNLRNASAVFYYRRGQWLTFGRAIFNLNPDEALAHFKDQFAPLSQPAAPPAEDTP
jgi:hypothetical protein